MNMLIVCILLDVFTTYDSCLTLIRLHVLICALHELNYNLKVVILAIVIYFNDCSELVSNRFRLGLTNIYSIDEYKTKVCFSILNSLSYMSSCTTLPPVLQRRKSSFRRLNKTHINQLQSVDIIDFLKQSCSYIIKFLRSGHLLKMSMCHDATTRTVIEFHALSGAGIN